MGMTYGTIVVLILATVTVSSPAAEIYTWTDADGVKQFSGTPLTTKQNAQTIQVEPIPGAKNPAKAHADTMKQIKRQIEAVAALRRTQNPPRRASAGAVSRSSMSDRDYQQTRSSIQAAWRRKEISKAEEAALYLDLERARLGLPPHRKELIKRGSSNLSEIGGHARVVDGDTVKIDGMSIRLYGIDSVEKSQTCTRGSERWPCGQQATAALAQKIGLSVIECHARDRDKDDRVVAVCYAGREDLNAWMVRQGWAIAYTRYAADYVAQEDEARSLKRNIWSGYFMSPEAYRHGRVSTSSE
jgi:endonuclease YncB( thermonuclease family)